MSKYLVDKFMRLVNADETAEHAYVRDPAGFVAAWEEGDTEELIELLAPDATVFGDGAARLPPFRCRWSAPSASRRR